MEKQVVGGKFYISKSQSNDKFFGNDSFDVTETQNDASSRTFSVEGEVLDEKISRHHHFRVKFGIFRTFTAVLIPP
jgi:hypothetical protein